MLTMNAQSINAVIIEQNSLVSLEELCELLHTNQGIIIELVEQELIFPQGAAPTEWQFDSICIKKAKTAVSFQRDLSINLSGVALALELLDKIEELESQLNILKRFEK